MSRNESRLVVIPECPDLTRMSHTYEGHLPFMARTVSAVSRYCSHLPKCEKARACDCHRSVHADDVSTRRMRAFPNPAPHITMRILQSLRTAEAEHMCS